MDVALPGCGLVIWHIDETRLPDNDAKSGPARYLATVIRADNDEDSWDAGGAPFLSQEFSDDTTPSSHYYSGDRSGLAVSGIPDTCAPTMSGVFENSPLEPAANDRFDAGLTLKGSSVTRSSDDSVDATGEAGEPAHAGSPGGHSVWCRWTPKKAGEVTVSTEGSGFDTTLEVYTGSVVNRLTRVATNDDIVRSANLQSQVAFQAKAKKAYRIAVDGHTGPGGTAEGRIYLSLSRTPPRSSRRCKKARRQLQKRKKQVKKTRRTLKKAHSARKKTRARRSLRKDTRKLKKARIRVRAGCRGN